MFKFIRRVLIYYSIFYLGSNIFNICPCDNALNRFLADNSDLVIERLEVLSREDSIKGKASKLILEYLPEESASDSKSDKSNASKKESSTLNLNDLRGLDLKTLLPALKDNPEAQKQLFEELRENSESHVPNHRDK